MQGVQVDGCVAFSRSKKHGYEGMEAVVTT